MVEPVAGVLGSAVLLLGLTLSTIGMIGLLRKADVFAQLHAAGLITGPGVILVLVASLASGKAEIATSALLIVAFVLVTSSLSTHAIAHAAWQRRQAAAGERPAAPPAGPGAPMRVLIAYDGSPGADFARRLSAALAWPDRSVLRLFAVAEGDLHVQAAFGDRASERDRQSPGPVAAALDTAARTLVRPGIEVETIVGRGEPAAAIVDEAVAWDAGLVVMGTRGLGPVRAMLLGSVAREVVDRAPCPVLISRSARFGEVLLAADGSEASEAAIEAVATWPIFAATRVRVLSVSKGGPGPDDAGLPDRPAMAGPEPRIADRVVARLRDAGRQAVADSVTGDPAARILEVADAQASDVIVLGSRGNTGLRRTILGSVAQEVLSSSSASVLVVAARTRPAGWGDGAGSAG